MMLADKKKPSTPIVSPTSKKPNSNVKINTLQEKGSIAFLVLLLVWNVWIFEDLKRVKAALFAPNESYFTLKDALFFIIGAITSYLLTLILHFLFYDRLDSVVDMTKAQRFESFDERKHRIIEYIQGMLYHSTFFAAMFMALRDTQFMPRVLGGSGNVAKQYEIYPLGVSDDLKGFYMFAMGHSAYKLIKSLLFEKHKTDFIQNILHHYITVSLIGYSFVTKHFISGLPILILHSSTDGAAYLTRLCRELIGLNKSALYFAYALFLGSWVYSRIFAYSYDVYWPTACALIVLARQYFYISYYLLFCLSALSFLNIFWLIKIVNSLAIHLTKKSKHK